MGGTNIDKTGRRAPGASLISIAVLKHGFPGPGIKKFWEYFKEEFKDQLKGKPPNKL